MKKYRICCLDPQGRVSLSFHLACRDDLDALAEGESISDKTAVEIWDDSRLVARVKAGNLPLSTQDHQSL